MRIYQLEHEYWNGDYEASSFRIGYYSSYEKAIDVRKHYLTLPGFVDHHEGFRVSHHIINADTAEDIWVVDFTFDEYFDEYIPLGIFESKESADKFIEIYKLLKGTDIEKGWFHVENYSLDKSGWEEGFVTIYYDEPMDDEDTPKI